MDKWSFPQKSASGPFVWCRSIESQNPSLWAAVGSLAPKIGCVPQTLNEWMRMHELDNGVRQGTTTADKDRLQELERENREPRKANKILKLAGAFFLPTRSPMPLLLKGVPHPDDGRQAAAMGVAGLIVSNQGGRTLDTTPSTASVLARMAQAVDGLLPLISDGIRRSTDVLKALAPGARVADRTL